MKKERIVRIVIVVVVALAAYFILKAVLTGNKKVFSASGTIEATEVDITSKVAGRLLKINVKEGDAVKQGQMLVELAHDELTAQMDQAEAASLAAKEQVSQVETNLKNAEENFKRAKELYNAGSVSKQQFDTAQTSYDALKYQYATSNQIYRQALASLRYVKSNIENAYLSAPISGVVLGKNAERGEMAFPGMTILTLGDLDGLWVKIYVPETILGRLKLGQDVKITTDSYQGKPYKGKIIFIASEAEFTPKNIQTKEERSRLVFAVKVSVENQNGELKPGMPADAEIKLE